MTVTSMRSPPTKGEGGTNRKLVRPQFKSPTTQFSLRDATSVNGDLLCADTLTRILRDAGFLITVIEVDCPVGDEGIAER